MATFQEHAVQNLAGFGWTIAAEDIPEYQTCVDAMNEIGYWWVGLDERTRGVIGTCDLGPGLRSQGFAQGWPALFKLIDGNKFGWYANTHNDVLACLERASNQVHETPERYEPDEL